MHMFTGVSPLPDQSITEHFPLFTWQDEIGHVCWLPLRLCVCVSVYHQKFVRSIASRVLEIS